VSSGDFDAVVAFTGYAYLSFWIAFAAAKLHRVPILFGTDATGLEPRSRSSWKRWAKKRVLPAIFRWATMATAPSSATAEYLQSLGVPKRRVVVTPFVVDNEYWISRAEKVDRESVRATWGIANGDPVVMFCAKLQPWKRPQDVLRAFARAGVAGARLVMAGDGPMRGELESEARALGCGDRVTFAGFTNQTQLPALYRSADVMVLPSEYDPCPVVVCEAMLCGCPVILSDKIRGRAELVRQAETGYYYPGGDVEALATLLREVLADRVRLRRMSEAARQRMQTWTAKENIESFVQAIERGLEIECTARRSAT
jgi:glycosyltransferase involved in cell wall biosynthesis